MRPRAALFIVMPNRKNADGTTRDIVHPINSEFRAMLESKVLAAYNDALEEAERTAADAAAESGAD